MLNVRTLCLLVLVVRFASPCLAQSALQYEVSFADRNSHYADVSLLIPAPPGTQLDLLMATWTPGSYLIREYSRTVDRVDVESTSEAPVTISKSSKNRWTVSFPAGRDVKIRYRVYCREMSVRTNWVDEDMAVLCGAATFLTVDGMRVNPHQVTLRLPEAWKQSVTALPAVTGQAHVYRASSFDELVDAPIIAGNPVRQEFQVGGANHTLASLGDAQLWDTARAAGDVQRIVAQHQAFWGTVPYQNYRFLNVISENGGGLEHDNSTLVMTSRWNFRDREKYADWLSLISHEFFHAWNVRRMRPAGITNVNYEAEMDTRGLWIAEGITSYYEDILLARAGLIDQSACLKRLSKNIERLQTSPGRLVQSLQESGLDAWVKFYRPDENSSNTRVSYYVKGCVVALLLDARIREQTANAKSLDDVMRLLYQRHAGPAGFTPEQFTAVVSEVAGMDMTGWLAQHVETTDELNYESALQFYGLQFPVRDAGADDKAPVWTGLQLGESGGILTVKGVTRGTPGDTSGFNVDDEVIAFNQYRASSGAWRDQLKQIGMGQAVRVLISRRGELKTLELRLEPDVSPRWELTVVKEPTAEQTARLQSWLGEKSAATTP